MLEDDENLLFENRQIDFKEVPSESTNEWLSSDEAAAYLRVSVGTLRNLTSNGHIPYYKLGRRNRYRISELRSLLLANKRGGIR